MAVVCIKDKGMVRLRLKSMQELDRRINVDKLTESVGFVLGLKVGFSVVGLSVGEGVVGLNDGEEVVGVAAIVVVITASVASVVVVN